MVGQGKSVPVGPGVASFHVVCFLELDYLWSAVPGIVEDDGALLWGVEALYIERYDLGLRHFLWALVVSWMGQTEWRRELLGEAREGVG